MPNEVLKATVATLRAEVRSSLDRKNWQAYYNQLNTLLKLFSISLSEPNLDRALPTICTEEAELKAILFKTLYHLGLFYAGNNLSEKEMNSFTHDSGQKIPDNKLAARCFELGANWGCGWCAGESAYFGLLVADQKDYPRAATLALDSVVIEPTLSAIHIFDHHHLYYIMKQLVTEYPHAASQLSSWTFNLERLNGAKKNRLFSQAILPLLTYEVQNLNLRNLAPQNDMETAKFLKSLYDMPNLSEVIAKSLLINKEWLATVVDIILHNPSVLRFDLGFEATDLTPVKDALAENSVSQNTPNLKLINEHRAAHNPPLKPLALAPVPSLERVILFSRNQKGYRYIEKNKIQGATEVIKDKLQQREQTPTYLEPVFNGKQLLIKRYRT